MTRSLLRASAAIVAFAALAFSIPSQGAGEAPAPAPDAKDRAALEARIVAGPSLSDLLSYAYLAGPMVAAERARHRAAAEKYRVDTAWNNPELMVEGMYMTETFGEQARPDDWLVRLSQDIPLPGKLGAAGKIAEADARIARLRTDAAARDTAVSIRESYHELLYLDEARKVAALHGELIERLRAAGEGAYGANRAGLVDVMKAQAQAGQLRYDALLLDELDRTERVRLNGRLSRSPDAPIGPLAAEPILPVVYRLDEIRSFAEAGLEEVRIADANVEKASSMATMARFENLPEFNVGVSGGKQNGAEQVGIQVGVMLPLWYGKNAGRTAGAKADVEAMRAMKESRVNDTRAAVSDAFFRLRNAERLVTLYRDDLLPQAERAVEAAGTLYRGGQGSVSDFVETGNALYTFRLSLARARADQGKFLARLESLAGRSLTTREGVPGGAPPGGEDATGSAAPPADGKGDGR